MTNVARNTTGFKNRECSFTELFSLLKRYEITADDDLMMSHDIQELKAMHQHLNNAIEALLQGLQGLGQLLTKIVGNKKAANSLASMGHFIAIICNLTEALNSLRATVDYELRQRGELDY
jgi:hypothetical protein